MEKIQEIFSLINNNTMKIGDKLKTAVRKLKEIKSEHIRRKEKDRNERRK